MSYNVPLQQAIASNSVIKTEREYELEKELSKVRDELATAQEQVRMLSSFVTRTRRGALVHVPASSIVSEKQARSLGIREAGGDEDDQPCALAAHGA